MARPVEELVTKDECRDEPTTQCREVTRARPQKKCVPVEVQKCRWVLRAFQVAKKDRQYSEQNVTYFYRRKFMRRSVATSPGKSVKTFPEP